MEVTGYLCLYASLFLEMEAYNMHEFLLESKEYVPPRWHIGFCVVTCITAISCQAYRINPKFVVIYDMPVNSFMYYGNIMIWKTCFLLQLSDSIKQALGQRKNISLSVFESY